jgi:hypothetical protein
MMATRHWMSARRPQPRLQRSAMHEKETKMIRLYEEANNMIATNGKTTNNYIVVDGTPQQEFSITRSTHYSHLQDQNVAWYLYGLIPKTLVAYVRQFEVMIKPGRGVYQDRRNFRYKQNPTSANK